MYCPFLQLKATRFRTVLFMRIRSVAPSPRRPARALAAGNTSNRRAGRPAVRPPYGAAEWIRLCLLYHGRIQRVKVSIQSHLLRSGRAPARPWRGLLFRGFMAAQVRGHYDPTEQIRVKYHTVADPFRQLPADTGTCEPALTVLFKILFVIPVITALTTTLSGRFADVIFALYTTFWIERL